MLPKHENRLLRSWR